ncbi:MAG TPA: adenylate/guanylate cyclase domain-containing protein [Nitrososphaeraceae archaeon]|nr:adenylate/guanylate cyclase domain-containing protein [Nitrososphaeraceae archaeon]
MSNIIVIPKGFRKTKMHEDHNIKYFTPRVEYIKYGETITWINKDSESHHLISGDIDNGKPDGIINSGEIIPQKYYTKKFDTSHGLIRYYCVIHPAEQGFIIINDLPLDKKFDDSIINDIKINYLNKIITNVQSQSIESMLIRHVDPIILETFNDPNLDIFRNKILSIIFWDISGFSRLCELLKNEPYLIVGFLREFFNEADKVIHKNNGILDKFIGDGIIAIFGFKDKDNLDHTKSVLDALNSAIELDLIFEQIKNEWIKIWKDQFGLDIEDIYLKCGINTGEALVGKINTDKRDQFTVFGSTVNLASRLQELAEKNQILISEETKSIIASNFHVKKISVNPDHKIKGFEYIKEYYEVVK